MVDYSKFQRVFLIYLCPTLLYLLVFGSMTVHYGTELSNVSDPPTDYFEQVRTDWDTIPFVELSVTEDWVCPAG